MKFHLLRAQNRMKQYTDARRSVREFQIGNYVDLKLQPYRQHSLKGRHLPHKLSPRFYGPLEIQDRVGPSAYKLLLPAGAVIHNVFHVSPLKLFLNPPTSPPLLPQYLTDVGKDKESEMILEKNSNARIELSQRSWFSGRDSLLTMLFGNSIRTSLPSIRVFILQGKYVFKGGLL